MKRKDKITINVEVMASYETTVEEALGLGQGEPVPEIGSDEWNDRMEWHRDELPRDMISVSIRYPNPAYDPFPGTVPLLPEHEPAKMKEWRLP